MRKPRSNNRVDSHRRDEQAWKREWSAALEEADRRGPSIGAAARDPFVEYMAMHPGNMLKFREVADAGSPLLAILFLTLAAHGFPFRGVMALILLIVGFSLLILLFRSSQARALCISMFEGKPNYSRQWSLCILEQIVLRPIAFKDWLAAETIAKLIAVRRWRLLAPLFSIILLAGLTILLCFPSGIPLQKTKEGCFSMIKHIVMWKMLDENKEQNLIELKKRLEGMKPRIDLIQTLEVGVGVMEGPMNWDICLYTEFANKNDLIAYDTHPAHEEVKAYLRTVANPPVKVDYEV